MLLAFDKSLNFRHEIFAYTCSCINSIYYRVQIQWRKTSCRPALWRCWNGMHGVVHVDMDDAAVARCLSGVAVGSEILALPLTRLVE